MMEKDFVGLSEASSAFNGGAKAEILAADDRETWGVEAEDEELELGLTLGATRAAGGSKKASVWGDYACRILTATDFPAARASPLSSSSSSSVSSSATKRFAGSEPDVAGSANTPSQVVVGWPPIRASRINSLVNQSKDSTLDKNNLTSIGGSNKNECANTKNQENRAGNAKAARFVKVNMDGDPIGRKVDLNAHQSYETLALALEAMFYKATATCFSSSTHCAQASKLLDGSSEFVLTYEDRDGDWMLVGDVPLGMFLDTVKRLRIMRTSDANGLAPRFQCSTGGLLRSNHTCTSV